MLVPAAMEELHEADAALDQPAGQQAIGGEGAGVLTSAPYMSSVACVSLVDVHQFRHGGLHAKGQLERVDPRLDLGIADLRRAAADSAR